MDQRIISMTSTDEYSKFEIQVSPWDLPRMKVIKEQDRLNLPSKSNLINSFSTWKSFSVRKSRQDYWPCEELDHGIERFPRVHMGHGVFVRRRRRSSRRFFDACRDKCQKTFFYFAIYKWAKKARASVPSDQFKPVACTIKYFDDRKWRLYYKCIISPSFG